MNRRKTQAVQIGDVIVGGGAPVVIQSMTDTDTSDVEATFRQIRELVDAGSEMVRVTVMDKDGARAITRIKELMKKESRYDVPLIGDFHFIGHRLLEEHSDCAAALDKYRLNPGNVGRGDQWDENFARIIEIALKYQKPVRIGVNAGSLDQALFTAMMNENAKQKHPRSDREVLRETMVQSALLSCTFAHKIGLPKEKIIVSVKVSDLQDVVWCYEELARRSDYALHLGLTEAGSGDKGVVISTASLAILLQQGIGDTIRVSLTPEPGAPRAREVEICKYILQCLDIRQFQPLITSCPGCGRTASDFFRNLAAQVNLDVQKNLIVWKKRYPGVEKLKIAVMGCVVNGPGESRYADIGISLPGKAEEPQAPVYVDGKLFTVLKGADIALQFQRLLHEYVQQRFGKQSG